jgi:hypothetical protein
MPKKKMIVVRVDESLIEMLKETSKILERKESETIRILLTRACKYWMTKANISKTEKIITTINEQSGTIPLSVDDDELYKLEQAMKILK